MKSFNRPAPFALLLWVLALLLGVATSAAAKPLYITVTRTFSSTEAAVVDVAFEQKGPVELRVLQPDNLEAFLDQEANLRRMWTEPSTLVNPGRALSRGINGVKSPGTWLLYALSPKMRKELAPSLSERQEHYIQAPVHVREGNKKLVGVPAGMTVVRRQWLNLDLGGQEREFDVPGFDSWGGDSGFEDRRVTLKPLKAGVYVLQLVQGNVEGQVVLVVTDLTVQVKQTDGKLLARVADRGQAPVAGAAVVVRTAQKQTVKGVTDKNGEALLDVKDSRVIVSVQRKNPDGPDTAIIDTDFYSTLATTPDVFLYTDRPIYHPGDEVRFRGVVRKPDSFLARLFIPSKRTVNVELVTTDGTAQKTSVDVDEFGSFTGKLSSPKNAATGVMRVMASVEDRSYQGETRVQDYVKPTFFLDVKTASEVVKPGETLKATVHAERYAGGTPKATFEVMLTRTLVDSPAWVDDAGMGGKGSEVTYGSASTTEGRLLVPERLYSSLADRMNRGTADLSDTWATALAFDAMGNAEIEVPVPALQMGDERMPWKYTLSVRARDDQGTFAASSTPLFLSPYEVMGSLRLSHKLVKVGQSATLVIRSVTLSGKPLGKADAVITTVYRSKDGKESTVDEKKIVTNEQGHAEIAVPAKNPGSVVLRVAFQDKRGGVWTGEERLLVIGSGGEAVEWVPELTLSATTTTLFTGDDVEVIGMLPDEWGPQGKNEGPLWVTLAGSTLFSTKLLQVKGNTVVVPLKTEKRFGAGLYVSLSYPTRSGRWEERTLPFRIVPKERVLQVKIEPHKSEAAPSSEQTLTLQVKDHKGRGVRAEISVSVVDKAVYAVQPEFRPGIVDFFYPLARNNVATFSSIEFQGYGYGHLLAKRLLNSGTAFASVKPPKKKDEDKDTAYWNGSIVTDDDGMATVRFPLPPNQTLWTVTAVVADTSGRVGEGITQFATRGKIHLHTAVPQFLRVGDDASGIVRVSKSPQSEFKGSLQLSVTSEGPSAGSISTQGANGVSIDMSSSQDALVSFSVRGQKAGLAPLSVGVQGGPAPLVDTRSIPVTENAVSERVAVSRIGAGPLALTLPAGASLVDVELSFEPTLLDASVSDLRELLVYPHGCLEQLVSTTLPVLALSRTLEVTKLSERLDPDTSSLLAEARSRGSWGVARILDHARKTGGFTWFVGEDSAAADSESDLAMTLIALDGLVTAADVGLTSARDLRVQASLRWLEQRGTLPPLLEAGRAYTLAAWEGERHAARVRALVLGLDDQTQPLVVARVALAAEKARILEEPEVKARLQPRLAALSKAFTQREVVPLFHGNESWSYPIQDTGALALVGRAAALGGSELAGIEVRFRDLFMQNLSTYDRSTVLLSALPLLEKRAAKLQAMGIPAMAGRTFEARGLGWAARLPDGTTSVQVPGFDGIATLRGRMLLPADKAPALSSGFVLERRFFALGEDGEKREVPSGAAVAHGSVVYVELKVRLFGARDGRSAYSVIEAAIPAGFTALLEDKEYRAAPWSLPMTHTAVKRRAFSPEKVTFYVSEPAWWMDQVRTVGFVMRADFAGRFQVPGATAEDMYQQGARARSMPAVLLVNPMK